MANPKHITVTIKGDQGSGKSTLFVSMREFFEEIGYQTIIQEPTDDSFEEKFVAFDCFNIIEVQTNQKGKEVSNA
jgi:thymidylate kinase